MDQPEAPTQRRRGPGAPPAPPPRLSALPVGGGGAARNPGAVPGGWVLGLAAGIVLAVSAVAEPVVAPVLGAIAWLTVIGFSRPPYAQLQLTGTHAAEAALVL